ncbi:unnamed protein product [Coregonus sp. 'balchen']|nr:unnamed protein product [Coregonus sp. 'balchen']
MQCTLYQDSLSFSEVNITVSSGNGFIQCIVNNHVSAEAKSQRMEDMCIGQKKGRAAASPVGTIVGGVSGHPGSAPPGEKLEPQFPQQADAFYSTVQQPTEQDRHQLDKVCTAPEERPGPQSPSEAEPTTVF